MFLPPARPQNSVGLSLIEILIVVALLAIITVISTPYLFGTLEKRRLVKERDGIVAELKQAQQKSRTAQEGESYGLLFTDPDFYLLVPENRQVRYRYGVDVNSSAESVFFRKLTGQLELVPSSSTLEITLRSARFVTLIQLNSYGVLNTTTLQPY